MYPPTHSTNWIVPSRRASVRLLNWIRSIQKTGRTARLLAIHLLDTNAISDLVREQPNLVAKVKSCSHELATSTIVRGEIRYGLERLAASQRRDDLEAKTTRLFDSLVLYPVTEGTADVYGRIRGTMERQGLGIDENDLWVAATALEINAVLATRDKVFGLVPTLITADWTLRTA